MLFSNAVKNIKKVNPIHMKLNPPPPKKKESYYAMNELYLFMFLLWLTYVQFCLFDKFKTVNTGFVSVKYQYKYWIHRYFLLLTWNEFSVYLNSIFVPFMYRFHMATNIIFFYMNFKLLFLTIFNLLRIFRQYTCIHVIHGFQI